MTLEPHPSQRIFVYVSRQVYREAYRAHVVYTT